MNFTPVFLPTDILLWLLVAALVAYGMYVRRHEHLLVPWARVRKSPVAMACATVLMVYALIGLTDSLHYRPITDGRAGEEKSVLDLVVRSALGPIAGKSEKTYSAPLATHSYAKETRETADGKQSREFPRLAVGGAHLKEGDSHGFDIVWRTLAGLVAGAVLFTVLCIGLALIENRRAPPLRTVRAMWHGEARAPWRSILITLGLVCLLAGVALVLGRSYHVLGTDKVGTDVLTISLKSVRTGLVIGTLTTLVTLPFAVLLGLAAGYFKGWVDDLIVYIYTSLNSIPSVLLVAAAVLMMQVYIDSHAEYFATTLMRADVRLLALCVILGMTGWTGLCRLLRGEALKLRELDYIQAARAFGVSRLRILTRHMLPNVMHLVTISAVMDFSGMVLAEAVLSYIGVGVDPTTNSFGGMINVARNEMSREPMVWWLLASAFFFMLGLVLAANLFADAVQEAFDPRRVARRPRLRLFQRGPVGGTVETPSDPRAPGGKPA